MIGEPVEGSGAWYRELSSENLQLMVDNNSPGSRNYERARTELDRREADEHRNAEMRLIKLTLLATVIFGVGGIVATVLS